MDVEWTLYLAINMFLIATLHFLGPIEIIQENAVQVKNTTEKTDQDVKQIKGNVSKIKG